MKQTTIANQSIARTICEEVIDSKAIASTSKMKKTSSDEFSEANDRVKQNNDKMILEDPAFKLNVDSAELKAFLTPINFSKLMGSLKSQFNQASNQISHLQLKLDEAAEQMSCMKKEVQIKDILMQKYDTKLKNVETENKDLQAKIRQLESKVENLTQRNNGLGCLISHGDCADGGKEPRPGNRC